MGKAVENKSTKIRFNFEDRECLEAGVDLLCKAYRYFERGKPKIEAIEKAVRDYSRKYRLPGNDALRDMLTDIAKQVKTGELMKKPGAKWTARCYVINEVLKRILNIEEKKPEITKQGEIPGKMQIELVYDNSIAEEYRKEQEQKQEMSDQTKMMRFMAGQADLTRKAIMDCTTMLITKLDRLNDTMSMILRSVRRE